MILFKKIRWKNFLSTGNIFTEINLNKSPTTLIIGKNGTGKSTFLDALSFGLFGKAFRNINKPQLINSITKKDMVVEIEFSIGSNEYKIIRGIKPVIFEVYKNGELINQSSESKDYQETLEKYIIKVNHKSFCQVVVLGSATFKPFMELTKGDRRGVVEDLLDLKIFTTMNSLLKARVERTNEEIKECTNQKKLIEEKIKIIKEHILQLQNNNDQIILEKKQRILDSEDQIDVINKELSSITTKIQKYKKEVSNEKTLNRKIRRLDELKFQIDAKVSNLREEINFFSKNDVCPTCKQNLHHNFKCETIELKEGEIIKVSDGMVQFEREYNSLTQQIKDVLIINTKINELVIKENRFKTKLLSLTEYKEELEEDIKKIKNKYNNSDNEVKLLDLSNELDNIKQKYNDLIDEGNILVAAGGLLKDNGIKAKIIKQYVPIFNRLINKYLSLLDFFVKFELDEEFNETIKSRHRDEFSYLSFSEGEKMRINLAILFTWRAVAKLRNSINTNILIMDEILDSSMDSDGVEEYLKILNSVVKDNNVFVITHKSDQMIDKFKNSIKFEKKKNFSRISA